MIEPSLKKLVDNVGDRYHLVIVTAKRARDLVNGSMPLVDIDSTKPVTVAVHEISKGKVRYTVDESD